MSKDLNLSPSEFQLDVEDTENEDEEGDEEEAIEKEEKSDDEKSKVENHPLNSTSLNELTSKLDAMLESEPKLQKFNTIEEKNQKKLVNILLILLT